MVADSTGKRIGLTQSSLRKSTEKKELCISLIVQS
jgi:hypothetical protein